MKTETERFRTRWRRWLGNKTRQDREYWVTLLASDWLVWVDRVLDDDYRPLPLLGASRERVKEMWLAAINKADMDQLRGLDNIYAEERWMKIK